MGCDKGPPKSLLVAAGTGLPVMLLVLADGGTAQIEPAVLGGVVVAGVSVFLYNFYEADFSLVNMFGEGVWGTVKDAFCSL